MRALRLLAVLLAMAPLGAMACELNREASGAPSIKNCPADVNAIIDRMYACWHWTGEEPYNAKRKAEIKLAVSNLKCDEYPADYKAVQAKYAKDMDVTRVMNGVIEGDESNF